MGTTPRVLQDTDLWFVAVRNSSRLCVGTAGSQVDTHAAIIRHSPEQAGFKHHFGAVMVVSDPPTMFNSWVGHGSCVSSKYSVEDSFSVPKSVGAMKGF